MEHTPIFHGSPGLDPNAQFPTQTWDGLSQSRRKKLFRHADPDDYNSLVAEIQSIQNYLKSPTLSLWTGFDLLNNWINVDIIPTQYRITSSRLFLRGKILAQVNFDSLMAFVLPFVPLQNKVFKVFASNTNNDNGMKLLINTLGQAYFYNVNVTDVIDLEMINFSLD